MSQSPSTPTPFFSLLARVHEAKVEVHDHARLCAEDPNADYLPLEEGEPDGVRGVIRLFHPHRADTVVEPHDTISLANALGYHQSFLCDERTPAYEAAIALSWDEWAQKLSAPQRQAILAGVELAWGHAKGLLKSVGFTDWVAFSHRQAEDMAAHEEWLRGPRRLGRDHRPLP